MSTNEEAKFAEAYSEFSERQELYGSKFTNAMNQNPVATAVEYKMPAWIETHPKEVQIDARNTAYGKNGLDNPLNIALFQPDGPENKRLVTALMDAAPRLPFYAGKDDYTPLEVSVAMGKKEAFDRIIDLPVLDMEAQVAGITIQAGQAGPGSPLFRAEVGALTAKPEDREMFAEMADRLKAKGAEVTQPWMVKQLEEIQQRNAVESAPAVAASVISSKAPSVSARA